MAAALDGVSVWAADASGTVALTRLRGPAGGVVHPPAHLTPEDRSPRWACDLDHPPERALLYSTCLRRGGVFDLCRWVDLDRLVEVWALLDVPTSVGGPWLMAFRQAGIHVPTLASPPTPPAPLVSAPAG